jgi:PGF-pre-PGF domain-containing protein
MLFLSLILSVSALTINSVSVTDADVFYSSVAENNKVHLVVNVTGASSSASAIEVTADFFAFSANCDGLGNSIIKLGNSGGDLWIGTCDLGDEAFSLDANRFIPGNIIVKANDSLDLQGSTSNSNLTIAIYNIGVPTRVGDCYQFSLDSTNFNQVMDFNNFDIKLIIEAKDNPICIPQGYNWYTGWLKVGELTFTGVNFNNNVVDAAKIRQLANIIKLNFTSSGTYQNNKLTIDTTQMPELDVNLLTVKLFHLSFISPKNEFIISDNSIQAESISWEPKGFDTFMQTNTFDLMFTATKGYKGFTITDKVAPIILTPYSPSINQVFNTTNISFNALVNGTGTAISKVLFIVNGVSNNATCNAVIPNSELYNCSLMLTQTDGVYNLSIATYDFGSETGNAKIINLSYTVQMGAPTLTVTLPTNGATYTSTAGSMLKLKFGATDGNGISSCWYSLIGVVNSSNVIISNCTNDNTLQLYLAAGAYNLILFANDTAGMIATSNISFTVTDTVAPVMTNNSTTPTSTKAILLVNTDESATCKYDTLDLAYSEMRKTFTNNVLAHTVSVTLEKDKVYDYYIRCSDLSNNVNKESLHTKLLYGVAPVENKTVVKGDPTVTYDLGAIPPGTKVVGVDKLGVPILNLIIMTNKLATDVSLKITTVTKPQETYSEKVYKYVTIEHAELTDDVITDVKIKFTVDKTWLNENNINKNDVVLFRYVDGWVALNTTLTRDLDEDDVIYYLADSPGLSLFAISKNAPPVVKVAAITTENVSNNATMVNVTSNDTELLQKRNINWFWVILLSIIVFVILVLFVLVQKNDKANPPIFPEDRTFFGRIRRLFK